ncbi:MAG: 6-phosphogluconolactonase [Pseudomonadota bacterium]|nr:6-phosphogluconolactonase [Pseudomonadota bacterium]
MSEELALRIAAYLRAFLVERGSASLVVSGGNSPRRLFEMLRVQPLDWRRVHIALADERWVDSTDAASNERLVREMLLKDRAQEANFHGFKNPAATPEAGAGDAWSALHPVPRPFDIVLLGMGDDGHTASLFPESPNLAAALREDAAPGCVAMRAPAAPAARLSLNLAALLDSRRIIVLIDGESKWRTYVAATQPGAAAQMPVRTVLRQRRTPVDVAWAP